MDPKLLTQADIILSKCGRPTAPSGTSVVMIPHGIAINAIIPALATQTFVKEISGNAPWIMRAISSTTSANFSIQIQMPHGKFLFPNLTLDSTWAGYGSYRYLLTEELECPPGSKIQVTLDTTITNPGISQSVSMIFDGSYKYSLKGGSVSKPTLALVSEQARYFKTPEQNIIAPLWAQGYGPAPPRGCQDSPFIYSSDVASINVATGPYTSQAVIQLEQDTDFVSQRILFDVLRGGSVGTASVFLARVRAGSGYALNDEYFDTAKYIGSSYGAKGWFVRAGDKVLFDLQLVDYTGTGNITFQAFLDGVKRKRRAA
jgi:hypothetical protein